MAQKKKNKFMPMILMLAALVVLGGVYLVLDRMDLNAEPEEESTVVSIQDKSTEDIVSVTFNDINGSEMTLVFEDDVWYIDSERDFPVDSSAVTEMLSDFGSILATRELDGDTGEYGFDDPQNVITVKYSEDDGDSTVKYTVGDTNSFNSGTYLRDDVSGKVYICSTNLASSFEIEKSDLILLDTPAEGVEETSVKTVTITDANGVTNSITDTDGIEEFLGDPFDNIDCTDWVEYNVDEAGMAEYGISTEEGSAGILLNFKKTISVTDDSGESTSIRQDATYNVWFGNTEEDGSVYYTITDSTFVYKLSSDNYDAVMEYLTYVPPETTETTETEAAAETTEAAE